MSNVFDEQLAARPKAEVPILKGMKMIANRKQCLEPAALNDLLIGRLPPDRFASALEHVESCELCTRAAEAVSGGAAFSWIEKAVNATDRAGFDHEPECQAVVGNLLLQPTSQIARNSTAGALPTETLGPYRLLKWLGSGGMGSVYLAEHQRLKRMTAIKLLPREKLLQTGWLDRFNREMTSIAALEHPHVVRAIDAGDEGGWHFLVMEYLDGADLSKVCRRMGDIPLPTACELVRQAALGLGAIHSLGMTHRDIKPSNLFLTRTGIVKLLDLGLVLSGDSPLAADERLTTVGHLMGTVPYMAREQLVDASSVDWRADIYSLGATLFRLLTGRAPFGPATNLAQTIQAISTTPCPTLKSLKPDVPDEVSQLVDRMLSHAPARRPQSAQEVAELLTPFCDAAAPQSLVRAALNCPEDQDEQLGSQRNYSQLQPRVDLENNSGKSKSRWPMWVAAAFVPLAFFAGILITVTTDKGTLVIESDEPGVSVTVSQGDKVVETLRVEKQPRTLRLQSGKYIVELTGVEGDGLEVSDSRVALTRGEKQVVRIQRRRDGADAEVGPSDSDENQYQGKSLAYWMNLLGREKDVAMIAQAMQAVVLLAETEQERLEAARKCMLIARKLGGYLQAGRPNALNGQNTNPDQSGWFMTELADVYPKFFPEPGLQVIIDELEHGNERSAQACLLFLSMFANGNQVLSPSSLGMPQHYEQLAKTDSGRAQLRKLDRLLEKQIARSIEAKETTTGDLAFGHRKIAEGGIARRIEVLRALGEDISAYPQVVDWAKNAISNAMDIIEAKQQAPAAGMGGGFGGGGGGMGGGFGVMGGMFKRSPLEPRTALTIQQALSKHEYNTLPVILAYLEWFGNTSEAELTTAFTKMAKEKPKETAAAIIKHFERAQSSTGFGGFMSPVESPTRVEVAKETLFHPISPDSIEVVKALAHALAVQDPTSIFKKEDIEELLRLSAMRLILESNTPGEGNAVVKDNIAIQILVQIGMPVEQSAGIAELLLARDRGNARPLKLSPILTLSDYIAELLSGKPNEANASYVKYSLHRLLATNSRPFIEAYVKQLKQGHTRSQAALFWPLIRALKSNTPVERQLDQSQESMSQEEMQTKVAMLEFLKSEESKSTIQKLDEAYQVALGRLVDAYADNESSTASVSEILSLLSDRLTIARFLGRDVDDEPAVKKAMVMSCWMPTFGLEQLLTYSQQSGYKSIPFQAFYRAFDSISTSTKCDEIAGLIKGLYESRPEGFRNYFLEDLEDCAVPSKMDNLRMYGGLEATCGKWYHAILKPLIEHPDTRARATMAIQKIIEKLPPESKHLLEDLLSKS